MEEEKLISAFSQVKIYEVEVSEHLNIEGEPANIGKEFGIDFKTDRFIYIVDMTPVQIYELIGEEYILSIRKIDTNTFKQYDGEDSEKSDIREELDLVVKYIEYLAENISNNITHTKYIADMLDKTISFADKTRSAESLNFTQWCESEESKKEKFVVLVNEFEFLVDEIKDEDDGPK